MQAPQGPKPQNNQSTCQAALSQAIHIAENVVQFLFDSFKQQLKINKMLEHIPVVETNFISTLNGYCIESYYFQGQKTTKTDRRIPEEQLEPKRVQMDNIITFNVKSEQEFMKNQQVQEQQQSEIDNKKSQKSSLNYSMSKSIQKSKDLLIGSNDNEFKSEQLAIVDELRNTIKSFSLEKEKSNMTSSQATSSQVKGTEQERNSLMALPDQREKVNPEEKILDKEIEGLKTHLYTLRRYRKQNIEEERLRMQEKMKKDSMSQYAIKKGSSHTYEYDGKCLVTKGQNLNSQKATFLQEVSSSDIESKDSLFEKTKLNSNSLTNKYKKKKKQSDLLDQSLTQALEQMNSNRQERNMRKRKTSGLDQEQKIIYSNGNSRQVSHLPFIKLKETSKISEGNKQMHGSESMPESFRNSINKSKLSMESNMSQFKSHSQLELERRLEQTRKKSINEAMNTSENDSEFHVELLGPTTINLISKPRNVTTKQSKMMQKYLKKLGEQKALFREYENKQNKSLNFKHNHQLALSDKHPLHRYYQYNYDEQKLSSLGRQSILNKGRYSKSNMGSHDSSNEDGKSILSLNRSVNG